MVRLVPRLCRLTPERLRLYRLLHTLLGFIMAGEDLDSFGTGFQLFYRDLEIEEARRIIAGLTTFPGLHFGKSWKKTSAAHGRLLGLYEQLHMVKAKAYSQKQDPQE